MGVLGLGQTKSNKEKISESCLCIMLHSVGFLSHLSTCLWKGLAFSVSLFRVLQLTWIKNM